MNEYKGSFSQAYTQAKKAGDSQFKWNGKLYKVEDKGSNAKATVVGKERVGDRDQQIIKNGVQKNRYTIGFKNGVYFVKDNDLDSVTGGKTFTTLKQAQDYSKSEAFKRDTTEYSGVAARTKINDNTPGFVKAVEHSDMDGNYLGPGVVRTRNDSLRNRIYTDVNTGVSYVVDNYGNIQGKTIDENLNQGSENVTPTTPIFIPRTPKQKKEAEQKYFYGFQYADGDAGDLLQRGQMQNAIRANTNEVLQKDRQRVERATDPYAAAMASRRGLVTEANAAQHFMNLPNNVIMGAARAVNPYNNYTWSDYANSFGWDAAGNGNTTIGLGDVLETQNDYARFGLNLINPLAFVETVAGSRLPELKVVDGKPIRMQVQVKGNQGSNYRVGSQYGERMGNATGVGRKGRITNKPQYGAKHQASNNYRVETVNIPTKSYKYVPGEFNPYVWTGATTKLTSQPVSYADVNPTELVYENAGGLPGDYYLYGDIPQYNSDKPYTATGRKDRGQVIIMSSGNESGVPGFTSLGGSTIGGGRTGYQYPSIDQYRRGGKLIKRNGSR